MRNYQVITTTPAGVMEKFYQQASSARQAVSRVKSGHFPGRAVKARVSEIQKKRPGRGAI